MAFLSWITGTVGYIAIGVAFAVAVAAHFFAPKSWSAVAWAIAFGVLAAAFVGQREITASVREQAAVAAQARADEAAAVAKAVVAAQAAVRKWRDAQDANIKSFDKTITEKRDADKTENTRRLVAVGSGTARVHVIGAHCTSPASHLPGSERTASVGDAQGAELSREAGQELLVLREQLIEQTAQLEWLQAWAAEVAKPVSIEEVSP